MYNSCKWGKIRRPPFEVVGIGSTHHPPNPVGNKASLATSLLSHSLSSLRVKNLLPNLHVWFLVIGVLTQFFSFAFDAFA